MLESLKKPFQEERAAVEWNVFYLVIIAIIALIIILVIIKPLFRSSQRAVQQEPIAIRKA